MWASNGEEEIVALRKGLLMFGILAVILTALIFVLALITNERRTPPSVITGLIATDTSFAHHGQIDLAWNPSDASDFAYYSVYAAEAEITDITGLSPVGRINDIADVTYETTKYRMPGLQLALFAFLKNTEYWFAVTAVDLAGNESEAGTSVSATSTKIEVIPSDLVSTVFNITLEAVHYPRTATVILGDTVVWTNLDVEPHTVTSDRGLFDEARVAPGDTFSYTFDQLGVFYYRCTLHFGGIGTIIVVFE